MTAITQFGERVRTKREQLGATFDDISLFSQIDPERLSLIEQGRDKTINALEITRLAFALGVTYEYLMFGKGA